MQMWQKHMTVVNKLAKSTARHQRKLKATYFRKQLTNGECGVAQYSERNDKSK